MKNVKFDPPAVEVVWLYFENYQSVENNYSEIIVKNIYFK